MIRDDIGQAIGATIGKDQWDQVFRTLNEAGKFDQKTIISIVLTIGKYLEKYEERMISGQTKKPGS